MARYVLVQNHTVVNIILWDPELAPSWTPSDDDARLLADPIGKYRIGDVISSREVQQAQRADSLAAPFLADTEPADTTGAP